jgi:hypothetical protein
MSAFLKHLPLKLLGGTGVYPSESHSPPMIPYPPPPPGPPYTLYSCVQYTYSHGGGGGELTREKVRGAMLGGAMLYKAGRKYQHD